MFGLGPIELLIVAVIAVLILVRIRDDFHRRGPFLFTFGTVPVDDPPPPCDPDSKREPR